MCVCVYIYIYSEFMDAIQKGLLANPSCLQNPAFGFEIEAH